MTQIYKDLLAFLIKVLFQLFNFINNRQFLGKERMQEVKYEIVVFHFFLISS